MEYGQNLFFQTFHDITLTSMLPVNKCSNNLQSTATAHVSYFSW